MNKEEAPFQFEILDVIENPDGTATIKLDLSDEFMEWFKKDQGLKRWSQKRFENFFVENVVEGLQIMKEKVDG